MAGKTGKGEGWFKKKSVVFGVLALGIALCTAYTFKDTNILVDMNENQRMGHVMLQAAFLGFCLNSDALENLANNTDTGSFDENQRDMAHTDFENEGTINEEDYTKQSIYSLLYAIYSDMGGVLFRGELYQFRFNTWGLSGADGRHHLTHYPPTQPQRHGKTAYSSLLNFQTIKDAMARIEREESGRLVNIVEIGSGTGAGANELTWRHLNLNYTAVEMQAMGTAQCKRTHGSPESRFTATLDDGVHPTYRVDNRLTCLHAKGQELMSYLPDGFADIVLISETHIADVVPLDAETRAVLHQVNRLLRPGGHFVWGNAIPTSIWGEAMRFLKEDLGFVKKEVYDVTENAVTARDEDVSRVEHYWKTAENLYYGMKFFPRCSKAVNRLFLNFCRHPGTGLYKRMLINSNITKPAPGDRDWCEELDVPTSLCDDNRIDSYVQLAYQKPIIHGAQSA